MLEGVGVVAVGVVVGVGEEEEETGVELWGIGTWRSSISMSSSPVVAELFSFVNLRVFLTPLTIERVNE